ncbi:MAG TPA: helix-turn-helix transcriptional regulator [Clostridia bacterium]|nr:helix-turn-helix transcriptional regulator [Clostridiaceae bacterium]HOF27182.1 helix-turn-helix transcriptional regulator [Clostridia bacterium]HOM34732.1 helix-turn-helix transcriptional regulator [Clostridia bacterium]HOR89299.1 helix-turn-helix transcriptional regulator [Clostridia bacterium]HOT70269.1 helix-turn-helix transcriptional regulator [Clostridia bacterium]
MKKLSTAKLAEIMKTRRKKLNLTQEDLSKKTKINRSIISRMEKNNFIPSIIQLENLAKALQFDIETLFYDDTENHTFTALRSKELSAEEDNELKKLYALIFILQKQIVLSEGIEK